MRQYVIVFVFVPIGRFDSYSLQFWSEILFNK